MFDCIIENGWVVTDEATLPMDIAISKGKVAALGPRTAFSEAKKVYNAQDRLILPGLIDPHVHMSHPYKGDLSADDFYSTGVAAAFGGTTTIIDFAIQWDKSVNLVNTVRSRKQDINRETVIDFALHAVPTISEKETVDMVAGVVKEGVTSFKCYMVYREQGRMVDDAILYHLLKELRKHNGLLMVHAENTALAEYNQKQFLEAGKRFAKSFPKVKPNFVEAEAINRILFLNEVAKGSLYIVHLSTSEGLQLVRQSKARGSRLTVETCTHYLTLNQDVYNGPNGGSFICSPPLRKAKDSRALWRGINDGVTSVISSDHCGFSKEQKTRGQGDFTKTPHGLPGVEARLPVVYTKGVLENKISINQLVALLSTNPAKIFGLYPKKGTLLPGSDADLVVLETEKCFPLTGEDMHGFVKWTPYEGMEVSGYPLLTMSRGEVIVEDGSFLGKKGRGQFIDRSSL